MNMRIGELADQTGVTTKTIRFYEASGLLPQPERTPAGYRQYQPADAERITFIKTAQRLGMSLDEIREALAFHDRGQPPCGYVRRVIHDQLASINQRIADLQRMRDQLAELDADTAQLPDNADCYCGIIHYAQNVNERARSPARPA